MVRQATNFVLGQGPAATVMKIALRRVHEAVQGMRSHIILTIHDEIILEVHKSEIEQVIEICQNMTAGIMELELPVGIKVGRRWGSMVDPDKFEKEEHESSKV